MHGSARKGLPKRLDDLQRGDRHPKHDKAGADSPLAEVTQADGGKDDEREKNGGHRQVKRRKERAVQLVRRRQKILMGKEITEQLSESIHRCPPRILYRDAFIIQYPIEKGKHIPEIKEKKQEIRSCW